MGLILELPLVVRKFAYGSNELSYLWTNFLSNGFHLSDWWINGWHLSVRFTVRYKRAHQHKMNAKSHSFQTTTKKSINIELVNWKIYKIYDKEEEEEENDKKTNVKKILKVFIGFYEIEWNIIQCCVACVCHNNL